MIFLKLANFQKEILDFTADNLGSGDVPDTIIMQDLDAIIHGDAKVC